MNNVDIYLHSDLDTHDIDEFAADTVILATGSHWRRDGVGTRVREPIDSDPAAPVYTPDDIFNGAVLEGDILIYDDEHYFMAGALAEQFLRAGQRVVYVTPETTISSWTAMTDEQGFIQQQLLELGIETRFGRRICGIEPGVLQTRCTYGGGQDDLPFDQLLLVTGRESNDSLWGGFTTPAMRVGDCLVPSSIADAVFAGHKLAREYGEDPSDALPKRERALLICTEPCLETTS